MVTWPRSMKEKIGRFPGPQAVLSAPAHASAPFSAEENNQKRAGQHGSHSGGAEPRKCQSEFDFPNKRICRILSEPRSAKHTSPLLPSPSCLGIPGAVLQAQTGTRSAGAQMQKRVGKGEGVSEIPKMGLERAEERDGKGWASTKA